MKNLKNLKNSIKLHQKDASKEWAPLEATRGTQPMQNELTIDEHGVPCGVCKCSIIQPGNKDVLCQACCRDVQSMKEWLQPKGRPKKTTYDRDICEWPATGTIPNNILAVDVEQLHARNLVNPWNQLKRITPKDIQEDTGCYPGYLGSLLLSLYFQIRKDASFLKDMKKAEQKLTACLKNRPENDDDEEFEMVHPFRLSVWEKLIGVELLGQVSSDLSGTEITYEEDLKKHSAEFCERVFNKLCPKNDDDEKKRRIAKYVGTVWPLRIIEKVMSTDVLDKFNIRLQDKCKESDLMDSYDTPSKIHSARKKAKVTPKTTQQQTILDSVTPGNKCSAKGSLKDDDDVPVKDLQNAFEDPENFLYLPNLFEDELVQESHDTTGWSKVYEDIFVKKTLEFRDKTKQQLYMQEYDRIKDKTDENKIRLMFNFCITNLGCIGTLQEHNFQQFDKKLMEHFRDACHRRM